MDNKHAALMRAMTIYDHGDVARIQHFVKVHNFAATIAALEGIDAPTTDILETAAILHDIGIHLSEQKYGSSAGPYQEKEGPAEARRLLLSENERAGRELYPESVISRVEYLIAHHHHYANIDGMDYQILVEADFLVNIYEDGETLDAARRAGEKIFRTQAGRTLLSEMYGL